MGCLPYNLPHAILSFLFVMISPSSLGLSCVCLLSFKLQLTADAFTLMPGQNVVDCGGLCVRLVRRFVPSFSSCSVQAINHTWAKSGEKIVQRGRTYECTSMWTHRHCSWTDRSFSELQWIEGYKRESFGIWIDKTHSRTAELLGLKPLCLYVYVHART